MPFQNDRRLRQTPTDEEPSDESMFDRASEQNTYAQKKIPIATSLSEGDAFMNENTQLLAN